jgi:hypothetical protein
MLEKILDKWQHLYKCGKIVVVIVVLGVLNLIFAPEPKQHEPAQQTQAQEEKQFASDAHKLLKEKVSQDASLNLMDYSQHKIPDKDRIDTQGTFDLNGKTIKFWATFEYSTDKPLRLKVADNVVLDEK